MKVEYQESLPSYERVLEEILFILNNNLEKSDVQIHNVTSRVKKFESFYDKILRKEVEVYPFEVIEDIAGIKVVCLYRSDLEKIGKIIENNFTVLKADTSRTRGEISFGYMANHYIVRLAKDCKGPRYNGIKNLKCEIQVKTILMDAWASVSHHLDYKQEIDIPEAFRADFNALSGLFYVADGHFEIFKGNVERSLRELQETVQKGTFDLSQEINLDSLQAYLKLKFPNYRKAISTQTVSNLVSDLLNSGYEKIDAIDEKVNLSMKLSDMLEDKVKKDPRWKEPPRWKPHNVGKLRSCLIFTDKRFLRVWKKRALLQKTMTKERFQILEKAVEEKRSI